MKFIRPNINDLFDPCEFIDILRSMPMFVTFRFTLLGPGKHRRQDLNSAKQIFVRLQFVVTELKTFRLFAIISASLA